MAGPAKGAGMAPEKPILCYLKKNIKNDNRESIGQLNNNTKRQTLIF
jgi:hypothetical protein